MSPFLSLFFLNAAVARAGQRGPHGNIAWSESMRSAYMSADDGRRLLCVPDNAMFRKMRNAIDGGTSNERAAAKAVCQHLPQGWSADLRGGSGAGTALVIRAPDGRRAELSVRSRRSLSPRDVANLVRETDGDGTKLLVVAPFVSPRSRDLLVEFGASYVDATGNLRVVANAPAVFLESRGEDRDPNRQPRVLRSLKGGAAGRVVRALCDFIPPYGVRTLSEISSTPLGTVSRVVSFLEEEALVTRDERKKITSADWAALIARWARDYNVGTSNVLHSYIEPRGLAALLPKLATLDRCAVTGSMAAPSIAPARLAMIYVDDADAAAQKLELVPTDTGANVWFLEPYDQVVFERAQVHSNGSTVVAALSQVAADLMTSPGRGPQEAEALIEKMKGNEHAWRRQPRP